MKQVYIFILCILSSIGALAQCSVSVPDTFVCHYGDELIVTPEVSGHAVTKTYTIEDILYQYYTLSDTTQVFLFDDDVTEALPIGFDFEFFGETYSEFYIGSNGWISFSPDQPIEYIPRTVPSNLNVPVNAIMAPWEDWDPTIAGSVSYEMMGTGNAQKLVVSYDGVGHYNCGDNTGALGTFQIVLNQEDFSIETHIQQKAICDTIKAVHAIQNQDGTVAYVVGDRNATAWSAYFEGTKFVPSNTAIYSWNKGDEHLSVSEELTINPNVSATYSFSFSDQLGCVSEVDFNVEVLSALDPLLTREGQFLYSDIISTDYEYQWYLDAMGLVGETNPYVELSSFGQYRIEIHDPETNCRYLSRTHLYTPVSILEALKGKVELFPNPTEGAFSISIPSKELLFVKLCNIQGELIKTDQFVSAYKFSENLAAGVYFLEISDQSSYSLVKKLIVE